MLRLLKLEDYGRTFGTSFHGTVTRATYRQLVALLGQPNMPASSDGKVTAEWAFDMDGLVVTLYDWKEYSGTPRNNINTVYDWHVGAGSQAISNHFLPVLLSLNFAKRVL